MIHDPPSWQKKGRKDGSKIKLIKDSRQATKSQKEISQNLSLFTLSLHTLLSTHVSCNKCDADNFTDLNTLYTILKQLKLFQQIVIDYWLNKWYLLIISAPHIWVGSWKGGDITPHTCSSTSIVVNPFISLPFSPAILSSFWSFTYCSEYFILWLEFTFLSTSYICHS